MAQTQISQRKLLLTSSLNDYFLCENCGFEKRFTDKKLLYKHIKKCNKKATDIDFNAVASDNFIKPRAPNTLHYCPVCKKKYLYMSQMRYHIRRVHFNLISKTPYHVQKKINQVWFEKVLNTNAVIEVRKTGSNSLLIRRLSKNTAIKVDDVETEMVDLSYMYPTYDNTKKVKCNVCACMVFPHKLLKHKLKHEQEKKDII